MPDIEQSIEQSAVVAAPLQVGPLTYEFSQHSHYNGYFGMSPGNLHGCQEPPGTSDRSSDPPSAVSSDNAGWGTIDRKYDFFLATISGPSPTVDLVLCSPASTLHYFGQNICRHLFICDTKENPINNIEVDRVRRSALLYAMLKYTTAEYHNKTITDGSAQNILLIAKNDVMFHLHGNPDSPSGSNRTRDLLLATMMIGMIASWSGTNDTGVQYYRQAVVIHNQARLAMPEREREFYDQALVYWWFGLAFVADSTKDALVEPPLQKASYSETGHVKPHSLTGVSSMSFRLMGRVGALIYAQRKLPIDCPYLSKAVAKAQERMLSESLELHAELSSLQIPDSSRVVDIPGAGISVQEMCNVAEAFRLCALLLLYRCFPDLLDERTTPQGYHEPLTNLALQALDVIERNSITSRTRSVEQMLLIAIAGELHLPRAWGTEESKDGLTDLGASAITGDKDLDARTQTILAARALVCTRMTAVRSILPYRSVEQAEDLIWHVWSTSDSGAHLFWMDAMIRSSQKFVMV